MDGAGKPLAGATAACVHSLDLVSPWPRDVVVASTDERGRARSELIVGRLYTARAVGAPDAAGNHAASEPLTRIAAGPSSPSRRSRRVHLER